MSQQVPVISSKQVAKTQNKCGLCSFETRNLNAFSWHVKKFHYGKFFLQCTKCKQNLYSKSLYRLHVSKCKEKAAQNLTILENETEFNDLPLLNNTESDQGKPIDIMTELCIELEGKHRASKVLIDNVVSKVQNLLEACGSDLSLDNVSSDYARKKYYRNLGLYVKPEECLLENNGKGYYIPFKKLISNLLKSPEYFKYFCKPYRGEDIVENGVLLDFFSGVRYNTHPVLLKHPSNVFICMLYNDDIEICNPLGMKRSRKGKLTVFYVVFLNIPTHLRSKLAHIHLLAVAHANLAKTSDAKSLLLQDFFEALGDLDANEGLSFYTAEGIQKFHGCLLSYTGDSLACHNIGGFKEGFSSVVKYPCRTCKVSQQDYKTCLYHTMCNLRNDSEINKQLQQLEKAVNVKEREKLSKEFGLKSQSVLSKLPYFSITKDLLYDPMHIFLEGVVPKEINLFLKACVDEGFFSRSKLNELLLNFKFHPSISKSLYPRLFECNLQLNASSSACLNLILHFPLILKDCFSNKSPDILKCLIKLIQIIQYILSPVIHLEMLENLENLIASHQQLYIKCYGSENLIPKMHMIIHLPEQIKQHGPTRHHWTMRMEAKNAIAKNKRYFNFKNLAFSVSEYFQMHFASNFWEKEEKEKKEVFGSNITFSDARKQNIIIEQSFVNNDDITDSDVGKNCLSVNKVNFNSVPFSVGDIVISSNSKSKKITFSKILKILCFEDNIYFYTNVHYIEQVLKNINVLNMKSSKMYITFKIKNLLHPWPVLNYLIAEDLYIILPCMYHCNDLFD